MARLSHRNVLAVYAFGDHDDMPYFVMEYIDGRTVEQWFAEQSKDGLPTIDDVV